MLDVGDSYEHLSHKVVPMNLFPNRSTVKIKKVRKLPIRVVHSVRKQALFVTNGKLEEIWCHMAGIRAIKHMYKYSRGDLCILKVDDDVILRPEVLTTFIAGYTSSVPQYAGAIAKYVGSYSKHRTGLWNSVEFVVRCMFMIPVSTSENAPHQSWTKPLIWCFLSHSYMSMDSNRFIP